jgi:hypothetical protein
MAYKRKTNRPYRIVTPATVAKFEAAIMTEDNATEAVKVIEPEVTDPSRRAWLIKEKAKQLDAGEYIDLKMQRIAIGAIERVEGMVQSDDERIATKNAHFVIDHVRGKALQRSESKHLNLNIEAVLE